MVDVRPFLMQTLFALNSFGSVLPKEMLHNIRLILIEYVAPIADMQKFVLPHMTRQLPLIDAFFETHVARKVLLSKMHHEAKGGWNICHVTEAAIVLVIVVLLLIRYT